MTTQPPGSSPLRIAVCIALVVVLGIVALAVMRDAEARAEAKTAHRSLDKLIEEMESSPTDEDVHELLGRAPDESSTDESSTGENEIWIEEYRWKGVFRNYTLTIRYAVDATKTIEDIRLH